MTSQAPQRGRGTTTIILLIALIGSLLFSGYSFLRADEALTAQKASIEKTQESLDAMLGELTRMRIEQSAEGKGTPALLEKLQVYAPMTADARITEPDFQNAKRELAAIVRAFESVGQPAWTPIMDRLKEVHPNDDFNEIKYLLEILIRLDPPAGKQVTKEVLQGHRLPFPRLRWWAADLLISHDKQLAGILLRRILLTESSRGIDVNRATAAGMEIPDPAAFATTGFNNYVQRYIRSEDPKIEDTLLMLLTRIEHDSITIQDCIKELAKRKSMRALATIKKIYDNPPNNQQNPLFLTICVRAIDDIEGKAAVPWLEEKLKTAPTNTVANVIQDKLNKHK